MSLTDALLPCPFCKHETAPIVTTADDLWPDHEDEGNAPSFAVMCNAERPDGPGGCGASGGFRPSEAEAIATWNRRASTPAASPIPIDALSGLMLIEEEVREAFADVSWDSGTPEWIARMNSVQRALLRKVAPSTTPEPSPLVAPRWMPIESAPKDGTPVLLGRFTGKRGEHEGLRAVDWYRTDACRHGFTGWGKFNQQFWPATHWMPLPAAPVRATEGEA